MFNEPLKRNAPGMSDLLAARYILFLMGFFAAFCGLIYNDFMSIPLFLFDSCYPVEGVIPEGMEEIYLNKTTRPHSPPMIAKADCVYPFGVDPAWYLSVNELSFLNSLKMKISVILGVLQMALGVCMKASNALF